ncbi:MAG: hypothetical protein ABW174_11360 [Flavitalea sp.]
MLTEYDLPSMIRHELPASYFNGGPVQAGMEPYWLLDRLTNFTRLSLETSHLTSAKKCFILVANLYQKGNTHVKFLIENIFVYALTGMFLQAKKDNILIKSLIPPVLYEAYVRQANSGGC